MSRFEFYDPSTGALLGRSLWGPREIAEANLPEGAAMVEVAEPLDHLSQRIDLETLQVTDYQPDPPPSDALRTWEWTERRWRAMPTLQALQRDALEAIDGAAGATRLRYITEVPGQQAVYMRKLEQATAYRDASYAGDVPPYVAAEAAATGATAQQAADGILLTAARWDQVLSPAIEGLRITYKRAVMAPDATADSVQASVQEARSAPSAL